MVKLLNLDDDGHPTSFAPLPYAALRDLKIGDGLDAATQDTRGIFKATVYYP